MEQGPEAQGRLTSQPSLYSTGVRSGPTRRSCNAAQAGWSGVGQEQLGVGVLCNPSLFWVVTLAPGGRRGPLPFHQGRYRRTELSRGLAFVTSQQHPAAGVIRLCCELINSPPPSHCRSLLSSNKLQLRVAVVPMVVGGDPCCHLNDSESGGAGAHGHLWPLASASGMGPVQGGD